MKTMTLTKSGCRFLSSVIESRKVGIDIMRALLAVDDKLEVASDGFILELKNLESTTGTVEQRANAAVLADELVDREGQKIVDVRLEDHEHNVLSVIWEELEELPMSHAKLVVASDDAIKNACAENAAS